MPDPPALDKSALHHPPGRAPGTVIGGYHRAEIGIIHPLNPAAQTSGRNNGDPLRTGFCGAMDTPDISRY